MDDPDDVFTMADSYDHMGHDELVTRARDWRRVAHDRSKRILELEQAALNRGLVIRAKLDVDIRDADIQLVTLTMCTDLGDVAFEMYPQQFIDFVTYLVNSGRGLRDRWEAQQAGEGLTDG